MYRTKLWDEDKWDIHSSSYNSLKYSNSLGDGRNDDKAYHEQKYGSGDKDLSSDYMKKEGAKEEEEKKKGELSEELEEKKKGEPVKEEEIPFKAAEQIFSQRQFEEMKKPGKKKDRNTIEDAIKKSIEEEKKVIIMDN